MYHHLLIFFIIIIIINIAVIIRIFLSYHYLYLIHPFVYLFRNIPWSHALAFLCTRTKTLLCQSLWHPQGSEVLSPQTQTRGRTVGKLINPGVNSWLCSSYDAGSLIWNLNIFLVYYYYLFNYYHLKNSKVVLYVYEHFYTQTHLKLHP